MTTRAEDKIPRFAIRCETCYWHKMYGAARLRCEVDAGKHARRFPGHEVLIEVIMIAHRFTVHENPQLEMGDKPPF